MEQRKNASLTSVVVVGSVNVDVCHRVPWLPIAGETLIALDTATGLGGKGANQAMAAASAGVNVNLLAMVGADSAATLREGLDRAAVSTDHIEVTGSPSGSATIFLDPAGENVIVVSPGANAELTAEYVARHASTIMSADVLLVQGEIPLASIRAAVQLAQAADIRTVINLAPFFDLGDLMAGADPLLVNEVEAAQLSGQQIGTLADAERVALLIAERCKSVIVTLGGRGAVVAVGGQAAHYPAGGVDEVIDTTGAGDAFVGVVAAALACGMSLHVAAVAGIEAGALAVTRRGASESYSDFATVLERANGRRP